MNSAKNNKIDAIIIGCPHAGIEEIKTIAYLLNGKKIKRNLHFCIYSSETTIKLARRMKLIKIIQDSGARIFYGTCLVFQSSKLWGWKSIATNSAKYAMNLPSKPNELSVYYLNMEECVDLAIK